MLCGVNVVSYLSRATGAHAGVDRQGNKIKVHFCRWTKGRVVWGLAAAQMGADDLAVLFRPIAEAYNGSDEQLQQVEDAMKFISSLRRLCNLSSPGLDDFIFSWLRMVIRLAETVYKCASFRQLPGGRINLADEVIEADWQQNPEVAYNWLKTVDRERKMAKRAAKDAGEYDAGNHEGGYRRRRREDGNSTILTIPTTAELTQRQRDMVQKTTERAKWLAGGLAGEDSTEDDERQQTRRMLEMISPLVWRWVKKHEAKAAWRTAASELAKAEASREDQWRIPELQTVATRAEQEYWATKMNM